MHRFKINRKLLSVIENHGSFGQAGKLKRIARRREVDIVLGYCNVLRYIALVVILSYLFSSK